MLFKKIKKILIDHKDDLAKRGVRALAIFGSTARNEAKTDSDIDVLIDFDSTKGLFVFMEIKKF